MTRRVFWQNVGANLVSTLIALAVALAFYRFWRGHFPQLEDILS